MRECATKFVSELTKPELNFLDEVLGHSNLTEMHLEIGTAAGGTLSHIINFYKKKSLAVPPFTVIDPMEYFPNQFEILCKNLRSVDIDPEVITFLKCKSSKAKMTGSDISLDFILIDGNHKVRHVIKDFKWARKLRVGGVLCIHDYVKSFPGVYQCTRRFIKKCDNYELIGNVDKLIILKKTKKSTSKEISIIDVIWAELLNPLHQLHSNLTKKFNK